MVLACQTAVDCDDYDLGDLAELLAEARKRVEGIDGTWERAKRLVYEFPSQSLHGRVFGGPLTAGDIAFLRTIQEQRDPHPFHNVAKGRLAEGINDSDDLASRLVLRIGTDDDDWLSWRRLIARYTGDPELRRRLMEDLLRRGDSDGAFSAIWFWSTNSRMPAAEQSIAWIQQVLALPERDGSDIRRSLRQILVREYGGPDHDFRELLDEFFDGKESPHGEILTHLLRSDSCRQEMAARVELAIDEALSDPEAKFAFELGMPVNTASPRARELWVQVVEMSPDVERRQRAVQLLASYHGEHPDTRALLRKFASLNTIRAPIGPERNLAREAFDWLEILDPVESATVRSLHRYPDVNAYGFVQVPVAFDTEGFREWCEGADQRRQRWIKGSWSRWTSLRRVARFRSSSGSVSIPKPCPFWRNW